MQLFINGKEILLDPNERVAITLQHNDLADISKPNTSYTNSWKIRKNAENVQALEYLGVAGNTTRVPYSLNNVNLLEDSVLLIQNGFCEITETSGDYYNINVYGAEKTFFEKIKTLTVKDCYPDTNITWNAETLANSCTSLSNFTFPIAQYNGQTENSGSLQSSGAVFCRTKVMSSSPYFFVKTLFQNIFTNLGYTVTYPMVNDAVFTRLVMPSQKGVSHFPEAVYGQPFNVKNCVPEMQVDKFIKEIMYRYQLIIKVDESKKKVYFKSVDDLLKNGIIQDWSDKFSEFKNEKYIIGSYGQNNLFVYKDDEQPDEQFPDTFPAHLLDGTFSIDNETLQVDNTVISSELIRPRIAKYRETNDFANGSIWFWQDDVRYWLYDNSENTLDFETFEIKNKEVPHQFLYLKDLKQGSTQRLINFYFVRPDNTFHTRANIPARAAQTDNLSFQNFLDDNYSQLINLLNNVVITKVMMKLDVLDIYKFDFFSRIYLKQFSSYFYVNKITNFEKNKLVEVELVKIPPVNTYYQTGGLIGNID